MAKVTRIDWTIKTGEKWWSGTNTPIHIEIYRDTTQLKKLALEPGNTPRLKRGELATYYWIFKNESGLEGPGVSVGGAQVPYYEDFPKGVRGHLRIALIAKGHNAWEKDWVHSTIYSGELRHVPGTIDAMEWVEDRERFDFERDVVLSTDDSEGFTTLNLKF